MKPSTGPVLHSSVSHALAAARSFFMLAANFFMTDASQPAASEPGRRRTAYPQVLLLLGVQQLLVAHEQGRDVLGGRGRAGYSARLRPRGEGDLLALLLRGAEVGEQPVDRVYAVAVAHLPEAWCVPMAAREVSPGAASATSLCKCASNSAISSERAW